MQTSRSPLQRLRLKIEAIGSVIKPPAAFKKKGLVSSGPDFLQSRCDEAVWIWQGKGREIKAVYRTVWGCECDSNICIQIITSTGGSDWTKIELKLSLS